MCGRGSPAHTKTKIVISTVWEISPKRLETRSLVALLSAKLLTLGIIQVYLILHSLIRNIGSVGMTIRIKKTYNIMKKEYTSPLAVEVSVAAESMLAASIKIDNNKTVDTSNGGQLSGERRGSWGDLWQ